MAIGSAVKAIAAPVLGGAVSGIFGRKGDKRAEEQAFAAAQQAQQIVNPTPFQGNSLFLNSNAQGQAALNPFGRTTFNQLNTLQRGAFNRAQGFDAGAFSDRLLEAANRVNDKRELQAFQGLESRLFNRQGASTGTARQIADFQSDIEDRRFNRALNAEVQADAMRRGLLGDVGGTFGLLQGLNQGFGAQQQQNLQGAQFLAPFAINNNAVAQAGQFRAQNTQSFFDSLGQAAGGAVSAGVSAFQNPFRPTPGGGFTNQGALGLGSASPFTSLGFRSGVV